MFRLDRTTHRYFIEPVSQMNHIKISIMKRCQNFINALQETNKKVARYIYQTMVNDCRSITGRNKRIIQLEMQKTGYDEGHISKVPFCNVPHNEEWRLGVVQDMIYARDTLNTLEWSKDDINDVLYHVCTS